MLKFYDKPQCMMMIKEALRILPFSHTLGTKLLLPGSSMVLEAFPARLKITDICTGDSFADLFFNVEGPTDDFTVQQDLERGFVKVFGKAKNGYFRYKIFALQDGGGFKIFFEKAENLICACTSPIFIMQFSQDGALSSGQKFKLKAKDSLVFAEKCLPDQLNVFTPQNLERLSLGCNKKQDWDLILRRKDIREILPFWFRLSQMVPTCKCKDSGGGAFSLLDECKELVEKEDKNALNDAFLNLFLAAFHGILVPRTFDNDYQGILPYSKNGDSCPLQLLQRCKGIIRSMFIWQEGKRVKILPACPKELYCGRFVDACLENIGIIDIEWTKKLVRKIILKAKADGKIEFSFQRSVKSFRLREGKSDRGKILSAGSSFEIKNGQDYYLDHFQK